MDPELHFIPGVPLPMLRGEPHRCPYLPGREARELYALPVGLDAPLYRRLMDAGFRRAGGVFYRADCDACSACQAIRVPVERFTLSRSQRRVWRHNADVEVAAGALVSDDERWELFQRYQCEQHDGEMLGSRAEFEEFLTQSPISTLEMTYRVAGRLIGVGVVDKVPGALSSVYFYFDPIERRRSLGVFSGLCEIAECRRHGLPHWYIGYHVAGCRKMDYKSRCRPYELLRADGEFVEASE